ncbi:ClpP/crotonase-like domain-containing protein [Roridomyces roridus]|uniref:ClpP/crotonase-like domain-containing protein n=1 Tax=Roridomyces roridus TaxID=1738132 RepID=A0AAD7BQC1_9AGAR|nr:ClpP/crotonase-like domain-containing protein [Roridomyces roridus]
MLRRLFTCTLFLLSATASRYPSFGTLQTNTSSGIMNVVINNTFSTINLIDFHILADLANLIEDLQQNDTDVRVAVFSSANPEYFTAHLDLNFFLPGYESPLPLLDPGNPEMPFPMAVLYNITQLPQATIAVVEGRARDFGNELILAMDMRFALNSPSVQLAQTEPSFGFNPAGGSQFLAQSLIGRGRAFEYSFSSYNIDAVTAAQIGWVNRAFDTQSELHTYVQALAGRIALFPPAGIQATKAGINAVSLIPLDAWIQQARNIVEVLAPSTAAQELLKKYMRVTNNQTNGEVELNYGNGEDVVELLS